MSLSIREILSDTIENTWVLLELIGFGLCRVIPYISPHLPQTQLTYKHQGITDKREEGAMTTQPTSSCFLKFSPKDRYHPTPNSGL